MSEIEIPVLVVGAGPAGLAAALELARHDVPCLLVERRTEPSTHPRATALSLRSMEIVRAWGLEAEVRAHAPEVDWRMLEAETLAEAAAGTPIVVGYPTPDEARMVSPTTPACIAQDDLESLLLAHVRQEVLLGTELTGLLSESRGVRAELRDVRTGAVRTVHARHVVAADGARSAVRRALGIPMHGPEELMAGVTSVVHAPLWDVVGDHRHILYSLTHPDVPSVALPAGPGDRWLFGAMDETRPVEELLRIAAGVPDLPVRVERSISWSATAQVAERWRLGSVLLAGDAAHRVTPRGGMGLNLALQDGYDLGWRLAWIAKGWAPDGLLDGYERERRPFAEHVAERSADVFGSRRGAAEEVGRDIGGRIAHVWSGDRSTLDLLAPGLTLFASEDWDGAPPRAQAPVTVRRLDPLAARALRAPVLARSDGAPLALLPGVTSVS